MKGVQHIAFNCVDRRKQEEFYTRFLGFRRARVFNPGRADEFVMLRLGSTCLELFDGPDGAATGGEQPVGFKHLAFEVRDLGARVKEMADAGVAMGDIIDCSGVTPGMRVCFFRDPDGNILELMENWADEEHPPAPA